MAFEGGEDDDLPRQKSDVWMHQQTGKSTKNEQGKTAKELRNELESCYSSDINEHQGINGLVDEEP